MASDDAPLVRLQVKCTEGLMDALGAYCTVNRVSQSDAVRNAIATMIGYDMGKPVERRGRKAKYSTEDERKQAARDRAQSERDIQRELTRAFGDEDRRRVVERMRRSLEKK